MARARANEQKMDAMTALIWMIMDMLKPTDVPPLSKGLELEGFPLFTSFRSCLFR